MDVRNGDEVTMSDTRMEPELMDQFREWMMLEPKGLKQHVVIGTDAEMNIVHASECSIESHVEISAIYFELGSAQFRLQAAWMKSRAEQVPRGRN